MSGFKAGQRVKVEYDATVASASPGSTSITVSRDDGGYSMVSLTRTKVTHLDPPDWPPQVGDIWEAEGREWFARKSRVMDADDMIMIPEDRGYAPCEAGRFKPLNPVLVRRRGQ